MSKDFIVFDPTHLEITREKSQLLDQIHKIVGDGEHDKHVVGTKNITELIDWASQKFGTAVAGDSQWTLWPPILLAKGHHLTFNLSLSADSMTFMMMLSDQCKKRNLIMIDPSGREPFITIPGGGGLLD